MNLKSLSQLPDDLSLALGERLPRVGDYKPTATSIVKVTHHEDGSSLMTLHDGKMVYVPPIADRLAANTQRLAKKHYEEIGDSFNRFKPEGAGAAAGFYLGQYVYGKRSGLRFRVTAVEYGKAKLEYTSPSWVGQRPNDEPLPFGLLRTLVDLERKPKVGDWIECGPLWEDGPMYKSGRRFKITKVEDDVIFVYGCSKLGGWAAFSDEGSGWEFATPPDKIEPNGLVEAE